MVGRAHEAPTRLKAWSSHLPRVSTLASPKGASQLGRSKPAGQEQGCGLPQAGQAGPGGVYLYLPWQHHKWMQMTQLAPTEHPFLFSHGNPMSWSLHSTPSHHSLTPHQPPTCSRQQGPKINRKLEREGAWARRQTKPSHPAEGQYGFCMALSRNL